jgi:DNA invertase Pin-like site-specific DNA recombinase
MGLYTSVSTHDQQTLTLQCKAVTAYATQRGGSIVMTVEEIGPGVNERLQREALMRAARRPEIDAIVVWRLGRAMAEILSVFAEFERDILRERVKAGIAPARKQGPRHGRPPTVAHRAGEVRLFYAEGLSQSASFYALYLTLT